MHGYLQLKNYQNNMISNKVIGDEAFYINLQVFLQLATKNADISQNQGIQVSGIRG